MTNPLRKAIESLIWTLDYHTFGRKATIELKLTALKKAYQEHLGAMTETAKRVEYARECLETGVSKREASRMLVKHDPRIGQKTAETLIYINFSGMYQTTLRGRRTGKSVDKSVAVAAVRAVDFEDEESIL